MTDDRPLGREAPSHLIEVCLEELRSIRAHADMRTQTHATLQVYSLLAVATIFAGFGAFSEQLEDMADLILLAPLIFFFIGAVYIEISYSVYIAEAYINQVLRPTVYEILQRENASDLPATLLLFEYFALEKRGTATARIVGSAKWWTTYGLPVLAILALFGWLTRPPDWQLPDWEPYEWLAMGGHLVILAGLWRLFRRVHSRAGLELTGPLSAGAHETPEASASDASED